MSCRKECHKEPKCPKEPECQIESESPQKPKCPHRLKYPHKLMCEKDKVLDNIKAGIYTETQAIGLYEELMKIAKNEMHREYIEHAYEDEQKHLKQFTELYIYLTGCQLDIGEVPKIEFHGYKDGLKKSFERELEAAELYRETILLTRNQKVLRVCFEAMSDEQEHTDRFGLLYNTVKK